MIFFVMLGLGFTGYLLPWDMKALFATKVGLQIAEATPLIGSEIKTLLAGHPDIVGAQTLTALFCHTRIFSACRSVRTDGCTFYYDPEARDFRAALNS